MRDLLLCLSILAACGGSPPKPAPTPEPAPPPVVDPAPAPDPAAQPAVAGADDSTRKLSREECSQALDHAIELLDQHEQGKDFAAQMREGKDKLTDDCVANGTKKDYDCLMAAKVAEDMGKCEEPTEAP